MNNTAQMKVLLPPEPEHKHDTGYERGVAIMALLDIAEVSDRKSKAYRLAYNALKDCGVVAR